MIFDGIRSLVREELDDDALLDFRVHRMIRIFERLRGGNALLLESHERSGKSGNGK
jgi:hypothetical protein